MATILLWQFDKFMQKNKIGYYNKQFREEFRKYHETKKQLIQQSAEKETEKDVEKAEEKPLTSDSPQSNSTQAQSGPGSNLSQD